jgi:hypothetical protein
MTTLTLLELVMTKTLLATFRFPQSLAQASTDPFVAQELVDFLKIDPSYFHQSFRKKYKPKPAFPDVGDRLTDESRGQTLDIVSTTKDALELLAATAALADFHRLVLREHSDRWEAIEPHFPGWRKFPGAYVLWTARIVEDLTKRDGELQPARLRIVRQPVSNASARDAVSAAIGLLPKVSVEGEDMIVSYFARKKQRPALTARH